MIDDVMWVSRCLKGLCNFCQQLDAADSTLRAGFGNSVPVIHMLCTTILSCGKPADESGC
jgi:hypothetical protein